MAVKKHLGILLIFGSLLISTARQTAVAGRVQNTQLLEFSQHIIDPDLTTYSLHAINLDGDSDVDIIALDQPIVEDGSLIWFENTGGQSFSQHPLDTSFSFANSVYVSDLDEDTDLYIIATQSGNQELAWWKNDGTENFSKQVITTTLIGTWIVYAVDLDQDTKMDILSGAIGGLYWWKNNGSALFTEYRIDSFLDDFDAKSLFPADLDGDTDIDIAAATDGETCWWENDGSQNFTRHSLETTSGIYEHYVSGVDIDSDTDIDLLTAVEDNDEIAWWENNGNGAFTKHMISDSFGDAAVVSAADIDNDGDIDILAATSWQNGIAWWENNGTESFTKHDIDENGAADILQAIDMDGDLDLDIVTGDSVDGLIWWEQLGSPSGVAKQAHYRIAADAPLTNMVWYEPRDTPAADIPFETDFRVRFQVFNDGTLDYSWQPQLEWSKSPGSGYTPVPASLSVPPFYLSDSTHFTNAYPILTANFGLGSGIGTSQDGSAYDTTNPPSAHIALGAGRYTEIEFNLRANSRADHSETYYFRLTDSGDLLDGYPSIAQITMQGAPGNGTVFGKIVDQDDHDLGGINITVDYSTVDLTKTNGTYQIELAAGTYKLGFDLSNSYWDHFSDINVLAGQNTEVNAVLVDKYGCLPGNTSCALNLVNMFPVAGTIAELSQVASAGGELCEIGTLYETGSYARCTAKMALWLASIARIPLISQLLDLKQGADTLQCVTQRLEAVGKTAGKYALTFWDAIYRETDRETVIIFQRMSSVGVYAGESPGASGIDLELSDLTGHKLSTIAGQISERSIPGSFAIDSDQGFAIAMVSQDTADFTLSFEGKTTGIYDLDVILPQNGTSSKLTYSNISITPQTVAVLIVASDNQDNTLILDTDGDGFTDHTLQPDSIEPAIRHIYLPVTLQSAH